MKNHNPYASPLTTRLDLPDAQAKKPIAGWIVQFFCLVFLVAIAVGVVKSLTQLLAGEIDMLPLFDYAWRLIVVLAFVAALVGTQRATWYGRVLGLIMILFILVGTLLPLLSGDRSPLAALSNNNFNAYQTGRLVGLLIFCGAFVYWFYAFGFSEKARRYFAPRRRVAANDS
ncbi:MAG: hypothetical protein V4857_28885 [Pseudomonadota bacterium]